jgi:hypothetical protein
MAYPFILFKRPNGDRVEKEIDNINQEDEDFLHKHGVKISMEDCGPFITIWADDGRMMPDDPDTPDEITYIVKSGETCREAMHNICNEIRKRQANVGSTAQESATESGH